MTNTCPNCGAPISGWECNYCGAVFYDFSSIDISFDKPIFMRFKYSGKILETKVRLNNFNVTTEPEDTRFYCGGFVYDCMRQLHTEIDMCFSVVDDILVKMKEEE